MPVRAKIRILCIIFIGLFFITHGLEAQQIKADVTLMIERLPLKKQEELKDFDQVIATYLNDHDWTGEEFENPIPVTVQIFMQDASVSYEDRYTATFLISNGSDLQYFDKYWKFPYQYGEQLIHQDNVYHPFTGFLDYYVYLLLAGEYDKMGKLAGSPYYERSRQIQEQAMFDATFQKGWRERSEDMDYIMSEEFIPFREMKDLFYLGLSYSGEDDKMMKKYCKDAVTALEKIFRKNYEHKEARDFMKATHTDLIDIFKDDPDVLRQMRRMDPDHKGAYDKYLN